MTMGSDLMKKKSFLVKNEFPFKKSKVVEILQIYQLLKCLCNGNMRFECWNKILKRKEKHIVKAFLTVERSVNKTNRKSKSSCIMAERLKKWGKSQKQTARGKINFVKSVINM